MSQDGEIINFRPEEGEEAVKERSEPDGDSVSRKKRKLQKSPTVISQSTLRKPEWAYAHLKMIPASGKAKHSDTIDDTSSVDEITVYMHVQSALKSFLGFHGTTMTMDFLKVDGRDIWIRTPRQDLKALVAAVGGWVGSSGEAMRVMSWGCWGPSEGSSGMDLFDD